MNSSKRPPQSGDSPPAVDPPQRDPSAGHEACRAGLYCGGVRMALPSTLLRSRNTCRTIVVPKIATGTSGIEYAPLLDRGTAYGRELHACQDQGDRRDWRDAFARRPDRQDARGAPGQPEASWPRGPVHRAHGRGKAASRGGARRKRSVELSGEGWRLAEGPPLSRGGEPAQIVIVRNRRMITARITIVRLPSTGLPYELTSTCAPPRTSAASARFRSETPATRTSMKALMSQGTPRFGWTLMSGVRSAPARAASPAPRPKVTNRTSRVLIPSACASSSFMITARATMPICVRCITSHTATPRTTASSSSTRRYSE